MSFWAKSFIFDGVPSETYDLFIISDGAAGVLTNVGGSSVDIYSQTIYRRPKPYFFGTQQTPVMEFYLTFASYTPIDSLQQQKIQQWLFGYAQYKKLQIVQSDMYDVYFNCILTSPEITTVGNFAYSFKCKVTCDSPWAWEPSQTFNYTISSSPTTINFDNTSDNNYYTYPIVVFTASSSGGSVTMTNTTDNNSTFTMSNITADEVITMNGEYYMLQSSKQLNHVDDLSGNFLRLLPGMNVITVSGNLVSMSITYQPARKVTG